MKVFLTIFTVLLFAAVGAHSQTRTRSQQRYLPRSCIAALSMVHPDYSPRDLDYVCDNQRTNCTALAALAHPEWLGPDLKFACSDGNSDCAGRVALVHRDWRGQDLRYVCNRNDNGCIATMAELHPQWQGPDLIYSCAQDRLRANRPESITRSRRNEK